MRTRHVFKSGLVAAMAGFSHDVEDTLSWRDWVDDCLTEDEAEHVRGLFFSLFGRKGLPGIGHSQKALLRAYISALEKEFIDWLSHTENILDFHVGLGAFSVASDRVWSWKRSREVLWAIRDGNASLPLPPTGVRLLPLVFRGECELQKFLDCQFEQLHSEIVSTADLAGAERVINCIEGGCARLDLSLTLWEQRLSELKEIRLNRLGKVDAPVYASESGEIFRKFVASLPYELYTKFEFDLKRLDDAVNTYSPPPLDRSAENGSSLRNDIYTEPWQEVG